tara:strand:+ start:5696 stop:9439 length:3744 start_codon:yes stop_codon:yes gene_type:complete
MADETLITLTAPEFENLMETQGLDKTVQGVLDIANEELEVGTPLTMESLANGTHPLLDQLDRYKGIAPEKRNVSPEEVLTLFTNVDDFGKYDPQKGSFSGLKAGTYSAARAVPDVVGAGMGFKAGLALANPIAAFIPPAGPAGFIAKGIVYGIGGIGGAIMGAIAASEAEDAVIGEAGPVIPSLQSATNAGETLAMAGSMLASPYKLVTSIPKAKTGALEFLENFKNVSGGKVSEEVFKLAARNAGMSERAAGRTFAAATAARERATRGKMFGGAMGANLGISRFNPAGYLFDPRKGQVGTRVVGGIEQGIGSSMKYARENTGKFLGIESAAGAGAAGGAYIAQDTDPYNENVRLGYEMLGSLIVPFPVQAAVDYAPDVYGTIKRWYSDGKNTDGLLKGRQKKDAVLRIMQAIRRSEEYADVRDEAGNLVMSADEKFAKFIDELNIASVDEAGNPVKFTAADLAQTAGLDFSPTIRTIQNELEKSSTDLAVATGRGREEMQAGAVNAIRTLVATGDPAALTVAARIQQGLFEENIMNGIDGAVDRLTSAATKVVGRDIAGGSERVDLSQQLYTVLENQIKLSKTREQRLWKEVGSYPITQFFARNGKEIKQPNVLQLMDRPSSRNGLNFSSKGAQAELNSALGRYADDIEDLREYFQNGSGRNPANAQKFFEMRSGLMNKSAILRKNGDLVNAGRIDKISDALLRDLTSQKEDVSQAYNAARGYTFARNNVFTRSFLTELQTVDKQRGLVMSPEQLLERAFRGGSNATVQRFDQIRAAGRFLINEGFPEEAVGMMDTDAIMGAALRDSLGKIMDKKKIINPAKPNEMIETFVVNESKLNNFRKESGTQELFRFIPTLERDLADATSAQRAFDNMLGDAENAIKPSQLKQLGFNDEQLNTLYDTKAFQWVLQYEDPSNAVAKALASDYPSKALNSLYRAANEASMEGTEFTRKQALSGLKSAILNNALVKSNNSAGLPNGDVLQKELFGQMEGVDPSVKFSMEDFLLRNGLSTKDEMADLQKAIKTMRGVEEAYSSGDFENVLFKNPSLAKLFYVRVAGATAGSAVQNKMMSLLGLPRMSGGLIAEQTGSEVVQKLLLRGPESQRIKIMTELFADSKALAAAMKEIKSKEDLDSAMAVLEKVFSPLARQVGRRIPLGVRAAAEEEEYVPPAPPVQQQVPPPSNIQGSINPSAVAPTTGGGSAPSPAPQVTAAPQRPPVNQSGPVDRARFAALFPEDRELMGIGSLIGA